MAKQLVAFPNLPNPAVHDLMNLLMDCFRGEFLQDLENQSLLFQFRPQI